MDYIKEIAGFNTRQINAQIAQERYETYSETCDILRLFSTAILFYVVMQNQWQPNLRSLAYGGAGLTISSLGHYRCQKLKNRYATLLGLTARNTAVSTEQGSQLSARAQNIPRSLL